MEGFWGDHELHKQQTEMSDTPKREILTETIHSCECFRICTVFPYQYALSKSHMRHVLPLDVAYSLYRAHQACPRV